jgi:transcription-repair coupling factor (superfamily II helicase)
MDRLVCGDVGFGKTEVAMRAAFIATANAAPGRRARAHHPARPAALQLLRDRFANWPVQASRCCRASARPRRHAAVARASPAASVDILMGTHKLLQSDIRFQGPGAADHRRGAPLRGASRRSAIKALRAEVDILTLTATPIPRTLNMALGGMRDLSIIATPPARRLSIKTFVREQRCTA